MGQALGHLFGQGQRGEYPREDDVEGAILPAVVGNQDVSCCAQCWSSIQDGSCWGWITLNGQGCCEVMCAGLMSCPGGCWNRIKGCWNGIKTLLESCGCCGVCSSIKVSCKNWCPLSKKWALPKKALAAKLENVANTAVMGIFSLNLYFSSFFWTWAPSTVDCLPGLHIDEAFTKWVKLIALGLPFTLFLPTLYVSGQAKALESDLRGLGFVAGAVLFEAVYVISLGAVMTICTFSSANPSPSPSASSPWIPVAAVTGCLLLQLVVAWACCCHYPKWLRSCMGGICCWRYTCDQVDLEAQIPAPASVLGTALARLAAASQVARTAVEALEAARADAAAFEAPIVAAAAAAVEVAKAAADALDDAGSAAADLDARQRAAKQLQAPKHEHIS